MLQPSPAKVSFAVNPLSFFWTLLAEYPGHIEPDWRRSRASGVAVTEVAIATAAHKKRADAAQQFAAAGRADLADKEKAEMELVAKYTPKVPSDEEARERALALAKQLSIASKKDTGKFMAAVQADGELALANKRAVLAALDEHIKSL